MNFKKLEDFMEYMVQNRTISADAEIYVKGERVFRHTAGFKEAETKTVLSGDELYFIYSCSKIATVTAGMQMIEKGYFKLSDRLSDYIPEFSDMVYKNENGEIVPAKNSITIEQLFTMSSGLNYNTTGEVFDKSSKETNGKMNTLAVIKNLAAAPLSFEPGTHWQYSLSHDVLAALIEVVSGKKFRDYMKENIFEPLEMNETYYHLTEKNKKRLASLYKFIPQGENIETDLVTAQKNGTSVEEGMFKNIGPHNHLIFGEEYDSGGAGIITSVSDYSKFLSALANGGIGNNGVRIINPETIELMHQDKLDAVRKKDFNWKQLEGYTYGLGVRVHKEFKEGMPQEFGWGGAAGANAAVDTKRGVSCFFVQHTLNPREEWYQPRLMKILYECLEN